MENTELLKEWDDIRKNVLKCLKRLGHDIKIVCFLEKETEEDETDFKAGDVVVWRTRVNEEKRKGIILSIVQKGESALGKLPEETKKRYIHFKDKSIYDRVLIAVPGKNFIQKTNYYAPRLTALKNGLESG